MANGTGQQRRRNQRTGVAGRPTPRTYGKQAKPLPLKGNQFVLSQSQTYEIPADSDDTASDSDETPVVQDLKAHARRRTIEPDPDDSPLSEDKLEYTYRKAPSPILSAPSSPNLPTSSSKTSAEEDEHEDEEDEEDESLFVSPNHAARNKKGIAKTVPKSAKTPRSLPVQEATSHARVNSVNVVQSKAKPTIKKAEKPKLERRPPERRLPVSELVLVNELPSDHHGISQDPQSSFAGVETQDPIADHSIPARKRRVSSIEDGPKKRRAPLTSLRKRLMTPAPIHKDVSQLRKKYQRDTFLNRAFREQVKHGDGFDASELKVDYRQIVLRRRQKVARSLLLGFGQLQLESGPLPDVSFESSNSELTLAPVQNEEDANLTYHEDAPIHDEPNTFDPPPVVPKDEEHARKAKRKVSFSDNFSGDSKWSSRLSTITAPKRVYVDISSDDESSELEEDEDDGEVENEDQHNQQDDNEDDESHVEIDDDEDEPIIEHVRARTPPSNQRARQQSSKVFQRSSSPPAPVNNKGVTLDFRRSDTPGMAPQRTPFNKRRLMEVNEIIQDDEPMAPDDADEMLDSEPLPPPPRSILRNRRAYHQRSDTSTRPEDTLANTRRNSTILDDASTVARRNTMVDLEDSRYFTAAADRLQGAHPDGASKPVIIKSRTSDRFSRSEYFPGNVQVPDSDTVIPETSQAHYAAEPQLNVLKRGSEAMWTSSESLPEVPRDLKTLTRSISQEHGTLSQSTRRRPSLKFQSPTKVR